VIRRIGLAMTLAGVAACAGQPPPPAPEPAPDTVAVRPTVPPPQLPPVLPVPAPIRRLAPVRLAFVGDINLGTSTLPDGVPPDTGRRLLARATPWLTGDLVVGNFEGVLADTGTSEKCTQPFDDHPRRRRARAPRRTAADTATRAPGCYAFRTPSALAPRLVDAGFTHLNLANNHANDYGPAGRESTERILDSLGIRAYGPLGQIAIDTVRHGDRLTVLGLIGFATYPHSYDLLDIDRSETVVDSIRPLVDLLVVTFHGGGEGVRSLHVPETAESLGQEPRGELRRWAHAVIAAGADVVVGHGPHVLRGIEYYRGKPVIYSLGNFVNYRGFNLEGPLGVTGVLQLEFAPDRRLRRVRLVPMTQHPGHGPAPDPARGALDEVRRLSVEDFGPAAARISDDGEISAPAPSLPSPGHPPTDSR
jgi:capsule synthesis protein PGA_cap